MRIRIRGTSLDARVLQAPLHQPNQTYDKCGTSSGGIIASMFSTGNIEPYSGLLATSDIPASTRSHFRISRVRVRVRVRVKVVWGWGPGWDLGCLGFGLGCLGLQLGNSLLLVDGLHPGDH
eukprot:1395033-Amorphochlora_amoeboformis.AAC.1